MGFVKDMKNLKQQSKEIQEQTGYTRPSIREAMHQASDAMTMAQAVMAQQQATAALLASGVPATATVNQYRDTGMTVNENPSVEMDLTVQMDGHEPQHVVHTEMVPRLLIPRLAPGGSLPVRVDAMDPSKIAIDWYRQ
ncbi:MAG: hypothetical protein ABR600_14480 [Actinomycetota bacterium]